MKILLIGGTGAIGIPVSNKLSEDKSNEIIITTRSDKKSYENINYIKGNAKDSGFIRDLLKDDYDAIIDFMTYSSEEFSVRVPILLEHTNHYFFFSSARCYSDSKDPITENTSRLLDSCNDEEYLKTDEYALAKAREEDILRHSGERNWTIIRPYITYNFNRLQLGVFEKENWLFRALAGRTIIMPQDIAEKYTTLTDASDVANLLVMLIKDEHSKGETYHLTSSEHHKWSEILKTYCNVIANKTCIEPKVKFIDNSIELQKIWNPWQIKYDRLYDRVFDNRKIQGIAKDYSFKPTMKGLEECLNKFLDNPQWHLIDGTFEGWSDRYTHEFTPPRAFVGTKNKIKYFYRRFV